MGKYRKSAKAKQLQRDFGTRLCLAREQLGLTQQELGQLVATTEISNWERGKSGPELEKLLLLLRILAVEDLKTLAFVDSEMLKLLLPVLKSVEIPWNEVAAAGDFEVAARQGWESLTNADFGKAFLMVRSAWQLANTVPCQIEAKILEGHYFVRKWYPRSSPNALIAFGDAVMMAKSETTCFDQIVARTRAHQILAIAIAGGAEMEDELERVRVHDLAPEDRGWVALGKGIWFQRRGEVSAALACLQEANCHFERAKAGDWARQWAIFEALKSRVESKENAAPVDELREFAQRQRNPLIRAWAWLCLCKNLPQDQKKDTAVYTRKLSDRYLLTGVTLELSMRQDPR